MSRFCGDRGMFTAPISTETIAERIAEVLRRRWSAYRSPAKQLARDVSADPRAASNWLSGNNAPHLAQTIELMAADPEVEALILDLVRDRRSARGTSRSAQHHP